MKRSQRDADDNCNGSSSRQRPADQYANSPGRRRKGTEDSTTATRTRSKSPEDVDDNAKRVEKPNYSPSGLLAKETNTVNGVVLKYQEPLDAGLPSTGWRCYVFKGKEQLDVYKLSKQSAHLFGRERKVVDVPIDHPSCSKQHGVIQFRRVQLTNGKVVRPYVIDLESANGTFLNGEKLASRRYYQLINKDIIKFGASSREYVIIQEDLIE